MVGSMFSIIAFCWLDVCTKVSGVILSSEFLQSPKGIRYSFGNTVVGDMLFYHQTLRVLSHFVVFSNTDIYCLDFEIS